MGNSSASWASYVRVAWNANEPRPTSANSCGSTYQDLVHMIKYATHELTPDQSFRDAVLNSLLSAIECEGDSDKVGEGVGRFCNVVKRFIIRL